MTSKRISELAAAATLTGAEVVPVVQGGVTKRATADEIAGLVSIPPGTYVETTGGSPMVAGNAATKNVGTTAGTVAAGDDSRFGASGASGYPITKLRDLSPTPDSVTDWGPIVNAALVDGTRRFFAEPGDYPFTTPINAQDLQGVTIEGENGVQWPGIPANSEASSRLIWKGTGSTPAINAAGSSGFTLVDMGVYYDDEDFTGHLIFLGGSGGSVVSALAQLTRCDLSSRGRAFTSAESIVSINEAICATLDRCTIGGARFPVKGGSTNSNANRVLNCTIHTASVALIANPYQQWTIDNCTFEVEGAPAVLDVDGAGGTAIFTFSNCWVGDQTGTPRPLFHQPRDSYWNATFSGNFIAGAGGGPPYFDLQGGGVINIVDNPYLTPADLGVIVDLGNRTTLVAPTSPTVTPVGSGGAFAAGTYFWKISAINGSQESAGSAEVTSAVASSGRATIGWAAVAGARGYRIYRSTTTGGESTTPALVATVGNVLTYNDTGTATTAGSAPASGTPAANAKDGFLFSGNAGASVIGESVINRAGHRTVNIYGNSAGMGTNELRSLGGHERVSFPDRSLGPTIAPGPAIGTGATVAINGSDLAGEIDINCGTGTAAGLAFIVTFGTPYVSDANSPLQRVLVTIDPMWPEATSTIGVSLDPSYLGLTQFAARFANAPSVNGAFHFSYRVIAL